MSAFSFAVRTKTGLSSSLKPLARLRNVPFHFQRDQVFLSYCSLELKKRKLVLLRNCAYSNSSISLVTKQIYEVKEGPNLLLTTAYESVWKDSKEKDDILGLRPLDDVAIDNSTRFLIQLLQDMASGKHLTRDIPTTKRCNVALNNLADLTYGEKATDGGASRAHAILCWMIVCSKALTKIDYPNKWDIPFPDRQYFLNILKLYSMTKGPKEVAQNAEKIVDQMNKLYLDGNIDLKVDTFIWNQALSTWASSTDVDRAYHAALFFNKFRDMADTHSYAHVLKACAVRDDDDRAKRLGAQIALRILNDLEKSELNATSYIYSNAFRALRSSLNENKMVCICENLFEKCCREGLVNTYVILEFRRAVPKSTFDKILRKYIQVGRKKDIKDVDVSIIFRNIPFKWKCNANITNSFGW